MDVIKAAWWMQHFKEVLSYQKDNKLAFAFMVLFYLN